MVIQVDLDIVLMSQGVFDNYPTLNNPIKSVLVNKKIIAEHSQGLVSLKTPLQLEY